LDLRKAVAMDLMKVVKMVETLDREMAVMMALSTALWMVDLTVATLDDMMDYQMAV